MTGYKIGGLPMTRLREILLRPENRPNYIVAKSMGINNCQLSQYALGRKPIPIHHVEIICEYFNIPPAELLGPPTTMECA